MKAIVFSSKDKAGTNIAEALIEKGFEITDSIFEGNPVYQKGEWELIQTDSELVYAEHLNELDYEKIIFASRHKAASGKPTLTTHICGNFGANDLGGERGKLSTGDALLMRSIFKEIKTRNPFRDYEVSLEATHHGPFIEIPHCWVELGSTEQQWEDKEAAAFLADCILKAIEKPVEEAPVAIGIGGNHYASKLTQYEGEYAFGHILPKYVQSNLNLKMLEQMIEKTNPEPEYIIIDKKGIARQSEVRKLAEKTSKEIMLI